MPLTWREACSSTSGRSRGAAITMPSVSLPCSERRHGPARQKVHGPLRAVCLASATAGAVFGVSYRRYTGCCVHADDIHRAGHLAYPATAAQIRVDPVYSHSCLRCSVLRDSHSPGYLLEYLSSYVVAGSGRHSVGIGSFQSCILPSLSCSFTHASQSLSSLRGKSSR